jgi:endonuclease-8
VIVETATRQDGVMPEGDTVWRTARRLHAALAGQRLSGADLRHPQWATVDLRGRLISEIVARGKHLLVRTVADDGVAVTVHSHLGMDGSWRLYRPGERWGGGPGHQIRVVFTTPAMVAVGYRLKRLAVVPTADEASLVGHLGPDLLGPDWDADEAVRRLASAPGRAIGAALLDQRNLAGIGNVYRAEVLFLRGLSPWTPVGAVPDLRAVVALAQRLLSANRERPEQVTTGSLRRGEQHWVYGRTGQPCRRCGTAILAGDLGDEDDDPQARRAYWCPRCQPARP